MPWAGGLGRVNGAGRAGHGADRLAARGDALDDPVACKVFPQVMLNLIAIKGANRIAPDARRYTNRVRKKVPSAGRAEGSSIGKGPYWKFRYAFDGVGPRWPWYFEPRVPLP